jgi:CubicO group peptidase (beta-lactamase class C family)
VVVRGGKVAYLDVVGQRGPDNPAPMKVDDIFRIYSMTKPIVSVAALMLVEEGRLLLDAPVARYIPAFANVKVGIEKTDASGQKTLDLVPPRRPMTVQDRCAIPGLTTASSGGMVSSSTSTTSRPPPTSERRVRRPSRRCRWPTNPAVCDYSNSTTVCWAGSSGRFGQTLYEPEARLPTPGNARHQLLPA